MMQKNAERNTREKPRVWVDISTLRDSRDILSGIPRTVFELSYPLVEQSEHLDIHFFGYDEFHHLFIEYSHDEVKALHGQKHIVSSTPSKMVTPSKREHLKWSLRDKSKSKLGHFYDPTLLFAKSLVSLVKAFRKKIGEWPKSFSRPKSMSPFNEGDTIFSACAMWNYPKFCEVLKKEKQSKKLRTIFLIYDIIPIVQPQFFRTDFAKGFEKWFLDLMPISDLLLGISDSTVNDIRSFCRKHLPEESISAEKLLLGFEFSKLHEVSMPSRLRIDGEYILTVSTIESRKNHQLLYYVWKQLCAELPDEKVPHLVIVGKPGYGASELIYLIEHDPVLNKKIHIIKNCSDSELSALYSNCQFTVYPSWYEGWGLPITESLGYGKLAIVSNTSSMPEAGSGVAILLPPYDVQKWADKIIELLSNRQMLLVGTNSFTSQARNWTESLGELVDYIVPKINADGNRLPKNGFYTSIEENK